MPNQPKTRGRTVRVDDETWAAVEAEAKRDGSNASDVVRKALRQMLFTAPVFALFVLGMLWGSTTIAAPWQQHGTAAQREAYRASTLAAADAMVTDQARALGCTVTEPTLTERVAVRNAGSMSDGVFDAGVVRVVSFDSAFAQAKAGKVYVVAWCK